MYQYMDPRKKSDEFRKIGNKLFGENKHFGAIAQYNKALVCARSHPDLAALCFGNRSAVYFELNCFKHCLHNIDLAEPHFPADKLQRLFDRREQCLIRMKTTMDQSLEVFEHDFKLSYKSNPKIPFFIDALELKEDAKYPKYGKHLITSINLKSGDVIAVIDKPWKAPVSNLDVNYITGCYTCGNTRNGDLIPGKCQALFCSEKCIAEHDRQNFNHQDFVLMENLPYLFSGDDRLPNSIFRFVAHMFDVFGSVAEMRKFVDEYRGKRHTLFDLDWSANDENIYYKNMMLAMMDDDIPEVDHERLKSLSPYLRSDSKFMKMFDDPNDRAFVNELWRRIFNQCWTVKRSSSDINCHIAKYTHPAMKYLVHCCDPNTVVHANHQSIIYTVLHPVKAGSAIRISTNPYYHNMSARKCLNIHPESCEPCKNDWSNQLPGIGNEARGFTFLHYETNDSQKLSTHLEFLQKCSSFINKGFKGYPNKAMNRRIIASKMIAMDNVLDSIVNPFPLSDIKRSMKLSDGIEKMQQLAKSFEFNYEKVTAEQINQMNVMRMEPWW